jgi:predicted dehydrogenase
MNTLCVIGGGRWSRVLLDELLKSYPKISIIWVTKNNYSYNIEWLNNQNTKRVTITQDVNNAWNLNPEAVIIATASHLHGNYLKEALVRRIPVLSEKPFCSSPSEAEELISLSNQSKTISGVNFEFTYASYLYDFTQCLNNVNITSIDIIWQDSFYDTRYGEKKNGDIYTPLMNDSFQHCWSLLNFLLPNTHLNILSVSYREDSSVLIESSLGAIRVTISLSRRAPQRTRIISVNNGEAVLNFAVEPGTITIKDQTIQNEWKGNRPLKAVFNSFFEVIRNPSLLPDWRLSLNHCRDVINLSNQATILLQQEQQILFEKKHPLSVKDEITRNLLIDIFLPKLTAQGEYHRAHNMQEQIVFSKYILKMLSTID